MNIKSVFGRMVRGVFSEKFVNECKRTIFMTSLYLKINRVQGATKQDLEEVNTKLGLVKNSASLAFPATLGESLWKDGDFSSVQEEMAQDNMSKACQTVMAITPRWMQYGVDPRQMERDIATVARSVTGVRALS